MSSISYPSNVSLYERMCNLALVRCFACERLYVDPKHAYGDICGRCQVRQERRNARATTGRDNDALANAYYKMYQSSSLPIAAWYRIWSELHAMTSDPSSALYHHDGMLSARRVVVEIIDNIVRGGSNGTTR